MNNIIIFTVNIVLFAWGLYYLVIALRFLLIFFRSQIGSSFAEWKWEELSYTFFSKYLSTPDPGGGLSYNPKKMKLEGYSGEIGKSGFIFDFFHIFRIYFVRFLILVIVYCILSALFPDFLYSAFESLIKKFWSTLIM